MNHIPVCLCSFMLSLQFRVCPFSFRLRLCSDAEVAENQAALRALHSLQARHTAAWAALFPSGPAAADAAAAGALDADTDASAGGAFDAGAGAAAPGGSSKQQQGPPAAAAGAASSIEVLDAGCGIRRPIQPGMRVKVRCVQP